MKIKSYLKGFGAGLFISAVLMGIATPDSKSTMTDAEIIQRAKALGMVEEDDLLLSQKNAISQNTAVSKNESVKEVDIKIDKDVTDPLSEVEDSSDEINISSENNISENIISEIEDLDSDNDEEEFELSFLNEAEDKEKLNTSGKALAEKGDEDSDDSLEKEEVQNKVEQDKNYTLVISKGNSSFDVAKALEREGFVESALDFDRYLCNKNYDNRINHGTFMIPFGASYDEIARIITGMK